MEFRWNLHVFMGVLFLTLILVAAVFLYVVKPGVVKGNEELIIGGLLAILTATVGYIGGYATGAAQSLLSPPPGPDTMTEDTAKEMMKMALRPPPSPGKPEGWK